MTTRAPKRGCIQVDVCQAINSKPADFSGLADILSKRISLMISAQESEHDQETEATQHESGSLSSLV